MDIFAALRESHERQRQYADALIETQGASEERQRLYRQLRAELAAHETAEERYFYVPLMQHDAGMDLSRHAIAEHHQMDEMVEALDDTDMSSSHWLIRARELRDKVHHHLKEEEQRFFQMAGKILTDQQKQQLAGRYLSDFDQELERHQ
ncbi:hemerythrin domain-containing protein [Isoalcanivorax beigongshangi]|uniref:Hemerythrin domain-containing protein n=1 Tax=Isoalcanivorax beigongshangi TaxID=3238810 RepID=A0ABV4AIV5_9GAMM